MLATPLRDSSLSRSSRLRIAIGVGMLIGCLPLVQAVDAASPLGGELQLRNGDHLAGIFAGGAPSDILRWQSPAAAGPFDFVPASVGAAYFPSPEEQQAASAAPFCVELVGGDLLFGALESLSNEQLVLSNSHFGKVTIPTTYISRILPWGDASNIRYLGPNGLRGWKLEEDHKASDDQPGTAPPTLLELGWREAAGQLIIDRPSPPIASKCPLPATCAVELSLGWQKKPDFGFTMYVESGTDDPAFSIRLQVVEHESNSHHLIAIAEGTKQADLAPLKKFTSEGGRFHAIFYIDTKNRVAEIHSIEGESLARLELSPIVPQPVKPNRATRQRQRPAAGSAPEMTTPRKDPGVTLDNRGQSLRLERLLVRGWNGRLPNQSPAEQGVLMTSDNQLSWHSVSLDRESAEIVAATGEEESRIPLQEMTALSFPISQQEISPSYRATLHDGTRLSGNLVACDEGRLKFASVAIEEQIEVPITQLSSLVSTIESDAELPKLTGRKGHLETDGLRSRGVLVESQSEEAAPLVWQPWGSTTAQPLAPDIAGRIVYRQPRETKPDTDPTTSQTVQIQLQRQHRGLLQMMFGGGSSRPAEQPSRSPRSPEEGVIYMRSGDRFPGRLVRTTDTQAHFESPMIQATSIPLDEMTMWERDHDSQLDKLDPEKRRRLLTIPRMQRNNPPTHLLETLSGDFLRARLIRIEEDQMIVEVRLEEKTIPLSTIRRILWLAGTADDSEGADPSEGGPTDSGQPAGTPLVLAVASDNTRLAFNPVKMEEGKLLGLSPHLGECQVTLTDIDILHLGAQVASQSLFEEVAKWQVVPAKDPKFVNEEASEDPSRAGLDAPLVGEAAPDFSLQTLDGKPFRLSEQKGQIVVLDFFATWCGPCIQAMPEVDQIVADFKDHEVELVAVNMQEDETSVKRLLARLEIEPTVVLDIDGATAEKYGVTAIPQTVLIDRDGRVARLYVGGGPTFATQLRQALESLTGEAQTGDNVQNPGGN